MWPTDYELLFTCLGEVNIAIESKTLETFLKMQFDLAETSTRPFTFLAYFLLYYSVDSQWVDYGGGRSITI